MKPQLLLSFIQKNYDFSRAIDIFSESNLKKCWKPWLTTEMALLCEAKSLGENVKIEEHYRCRDDSCDSKNMYLRYKVNSGVDKIKEKRGASRSDFSFEEKGVAQHFEVRCCDDSTLKTQKQISIFEGDMIRIEALKKVNPSMSINTLFAFYGSFSSEEISLLKKMDNNKRCSYVLDTSLTGSCSIARLSQIKRGGDERLCLAAYGV